ncbi:hypothetical protein ALP72_02259 [Pseudomonas coronafaciens pv. coronafaciens]|uniref:hypothetical protein n=1 Tax=Pseudomonas coronafaciens TaxID=53409 RepID=UPI000F0056FA|nr:hypothetical protein [Pseudomonas coronafaciens]RMS11931.1 hypothetical protein ALP72_02259 [Pseudomonas coronafaciens pv. coronafaciens]
MSDNQKTLEQLRAVLGNLINKEIEYIDLLDLDENEREEALGLTLEMVKAFTEYGYTYKKQKRLLLTDQCVGAMVFGIDYKSSFRYLELTRRSEVVEKISTYPENTKMFSGWANLISEKALEYTKKFVF